MLILSFQDLKLGFLAPIYKYELFIFPKGFDSRFCPKALFTQKLLIIKEVVKVQKSIFDELKHNETLQNKFIRAWSSIEEYTDKADSNKSREVQGLLGYLDSNSDVPILEELKKSEG